MILSLNTVNTFSFISQDIRCINEILHRSRSFPSKYFLFTHSEIDRLTFSLCCRCNDPLRYSLSLSFADQHAVLDSFSLRSIGSVLRSSRCSSVAEQLLFQCEDEFLAIDRVHEDSLRTRESQSVDIRLQSHSSSWPPSR